MIKGLIFKFHTISLTEKAYGDDGCLKQAKELSINKVGHGKYIHGAIRFKEKNNVTSCCISFQSIMLSLS